MNHDADTPPFAHPLAADAPDRLRLLLVDLSSLRRAAGYGLALSDRKLYLAKAAGRNRGEPAIRGGGGPSSYSDLPAKGGFSAPPSLRSRDR